MRAPGGVVEDVVPLPKTEEAVFLALRDLLDRPELLQAPEAVVDRLVYRGRTTGLVGPDKSGKSTLAAHAVAALTRPGRFLRDRLEPGTAIVAAPDEAVGDTVRRLHRLKANPDRVRLLTIHPPDLYGELCRTLDAESADLVVVDSLAEWARLTMGQAPDDGDAAGWGAVVRPLVALSRSHDCGVLLLHHPRRSDGQYRGSGEIAAALDCLLEMRLPNNGEDPTLRRFTGRARWPVEDFSIAFRDGRFEMAGGGEISLDARVLLYVETNPGVSKTELRKKIHGRASTVDAAVHRLEERGAVRDEGSGGRTAYHATSKAPRLEGLE